MCIPFVFCRMYKTAEAFRSSWRSQLRQKESNNMEVSRITMSKRENHRRKKGQGTNTRERLESEEWMPSCIAETKTRGKWRDKLPTPSFTHTPQVYTVP
jgi:hypothetical protein